MISTPTIANLEEVVESLSAEEQALFRRIYGLTTAVGELSIPGGMESWVREHFGSLGRVTRQKIVRVTNKVTLEEALFNKLRSSRPVDPREEGPLSRFSGVSKDDPFNSPEDSTPEDLFGRVLGSHCITASNIAKYDGLHGVVVFSDPNPLQFSQEQVIDYLDVGWEWAKRAHKSAPQAKYFFLLWNCLWRAGASVYHGHAQVVLAQDKHYARIERLRQAAFDYGQKYGSAYFSDLFRVHQSLGCAVEKDGVRILAYLTPFKDNGVIIFTNELSLSFKERLYEVLACFRDRLGVVSFNLGLAAPPLADTEESWEGFPVIAWLVDRGDPASRVSDVGGMEVFAASIISSDPFELARKLREHLSLGG